MCIANVDVFYKQMTPVTFFIIERRRLVTRSSHPVFTNENEVERRRHLGANFVHLFFRYSFVNSLSILNNAGRRK
jgi:hypothetical protein